MKYVYENGKIKYNMFAKGINGVRVYIKNNNRGIKFMCILIDHECIKSEICTCIYGDCLKRYYKNYTKKIFLIIESNLIKSAREYEIKI